MNNQTCLAPVDLDFAADEMALVARSAAEQGMSVDEFIGVACRDALSERALRRAVRLVPSPLPFRALGIV